VPSSRKIPRPRPRTVVLYNEPADEYQAQLGDYLDHFCPQTKPEADLVHQQ
jgi:hypothetical protein